MIKIDKSLFEISTEKNYSNHFSIFSSLEKKINNFNVYNNSILDEEQNAILLEHKEEKSLIYLLNLVKTINLVQLLLFKDNEKIFINLFEEFINLNEENDLDEEDTLDIKKNFNMNYSEKDKNKKRISYENRNKLANKDMKIIVKEMKNISLNLEFNEVRKSLMNEFKEIMIEINNPKVDIKSMVNKLNILLSKINGEEINLKNILNDITKVKNNLEEKEIDTKVLMKNINNVEINVEKIKNKKFYKSIDILILKFNKLNPTNFVVSKLEKNLNEKNNLKYMDVNFNEKYNEKNIDINFDVLNINRNKSKTVLFYLNEDFLFSENNDWNNIVKEKIADKWNKKYYFDMQRYNYNVSSKIQDNNLRYKIIDADQNSKNFNHEIKNINFIVDGKKLEKGIDYTINKEFSVYTEELMDFLDKNMKMTKEIVNILVKFNMRLIISLAKRYLNKMKKNIDFNELKNEGLIGFINAMHKFELNSDLKISTYATWWIRQSIIQYINNNKNSIKIPLYYTNIINDYNNLITKLENDDDPDKDKVEDINWVAERLEITSSKLRSALFFTKNSTVISMHQSNSDNDEYTIEDFLSYEHDKTTEETVMEEETKKLLKKAIEKLNEKEKFIIMERHELFNENPKTLEDLGKKLDLTKERIRQIEVEAFKKIKRILSDFIEEDQDF